MKDVNSALISGYAKLPSNVTSESVFSSLVVVVIFDKRNGVVIDAEVSLVTDLAKEFVSDLLVGYDLNQGPEDLIALLENHYFGSVRKALETALKMIFARFQELQADSTR